MGKLRTKLNELKKLYKTKAKYQFHQPQYFAIVNGTSPKGKKILLESYHEEDFDYSFILKRPTGVGEGQELIHEAYAQGWKPESTTIMLKSIYAAIQKVHHDQLIVMYMELLGKEFSGIVQTIEYLEPLYVGCALDYLGELAEQEEADMLYGCANDVLDAELDEKVQEYINSAEVIEDVQHRVTQESLSSTEASEIFADMAELYKNKLIEETVNEESKDQER